MGGGYLLPVAERSAEDNSHHATPVPEGVRLPRQNIKTPIPRVSDPERQAAVVAFLLSDDASFMTGTAVMVNGGYTPI